MFFFMALKPHSKLSSFRFASVSMKIVYCKAFFRFKKKNKEKEVNRLNKSILYLIRRISQDGNIKVNPYVAMILVDSVCMC